MPIYKYECPNCGEFEELQLLPKPLKVCPKCCADVKLKVSVANIQFKGDNFYSNQKS